MPWAQYIIIIQSQHSPGEQNGTLFTSMYAYASLGVCCDLSLSRLMQPSQDILVFLLRISPSWTSLSVQQFFLRWCPSQASLSVNQVPTLSSNVLLFLWAESSFLVLFMFNSTHLVVTHSCSWPVDSKSTIYCQSLQERTTLCSQLLGHMSYG